MPMEDSLHARVSNGPSALALGVIGNVMTTTAPTSTVARFCLPPQLNDDIGPPNFRFTPAQAGTTPASLQSFIPASAGNASYENATTPVSRSGSGPETRLEFGEYCQCRVEVAPVDVGGAQEP
jgi:hypothetical protein